ncbi:MAG: hypothetical protein AAGG44_15585 [Planctomycetota bacterium]
MMVIDSIRRATTCCSLLSLTVAGVTGAVPSCFGQVVQQPVFRNFSYSGGAWVPDSGTGFLAGRQYSNRNRVSRGFGPYSPSAASGQFGGSAISASVTIIDLNALDEAILNAPTTATQNARGAAASSSPVGGSSAVQTPKLAGARSKVVTTTSRYFDATKAANVRDHGGYQRALNGHYQSSVRPAATDSQVESDVRYYLSEGQKAERGGSIIAARVYYRMAMEAMTPEMLERYRKVLEKRKAEAEERRKKNSPNSISF